MESISTATLLARTIFTFDTPRTVIEAFALLLPDLHVRFTILCHSHRGILRDSIRRIVLLRDAVLDPSPQDTFITIRFSRFDSGQCLHYGEYGTLCLEMSNHDEVGTIEFRLFGSFGRYAEATPFYPSFSGTDRAFYIRERSLGGVPTAFEYDACGDEGTYKLQGKHASGVTRSSTLRFLTTRAVVDYDPYCGRLCLRSGEKKDGVIEILDIFA